MEFQEVRDYKIPDAFWRRKCRPKPDTADLIMTLPPELRNRIYLEVLPARQTYGNTRGNTVEKLPLLQLSKHIRTETACIFFGNNRFGIHGRIESLAFAAGIQKCRRVVTLCGPHPFFQLRFHDLGANGQILSQIAKLLPLLELMRELKFEPDRHFAPAPADQASWEDKARSIESGKSLFSGVRYTAVHDVLGRAIALGRRARDEQWTREKLEERFAAFVKFAMKGPKKHLPPMRPPKWPATF